MSTASLRDIIAPCPFCGGTANVYTYECQDPFVGCNGGRGDVTCDANGPSMPTEAEAIARWNRRTPAAGYRVVREGEVDRETVLKCIALIEQSWKPVGAGDGQTFVVGCGGGTAALRALAEAKP